MYLLICSSLLLISADAFTIPPPCDPHVDPNCLSPVPPGGGDEKHVPAAFAPSSNHHASRSTSVSARISGPPPSLDPTSNDDDDAVSTSKSLQTRLSTMVQSDREQTSAEEEEYKTKLAEAERAIAEAEAARKKLLLAKNNGGSSTGDITTSTMQSALAPASCRSTISRTDAGTLVINVPPIGLKAESILPGVFSLVWFSAIIPATFAGGIGSALFLLPFWASGGLVAKLAFYDPFLGGELSIGQYAWSLRGTYAGIKKKERDGATEELRGAAAEVALYVNEVPKGELRLYGEKGMISLGLGLGFDELEYLAGEINQHLSDLKEMKDADPLYEGVL